MNYVKVHNYGITSSKIYGFENPLLKIYGFSQTHQTHANDTTAYKRFVVISIMNFRYKYSRKLTLCILHWLGRVNSVILDNLGKQGRVNSENFGVNSEIWKTSAKPGRVNSENLGVNSEILETDPRLARQGQQ